MASFGVEGPPVLHAGTSCEWPSGARIPGRPVPRANGAPSDGTPPAHPPPKCKPKKTRPRPMALPSKDGGHTLQVDPEGPEGHDSAKQRAHTNPRRIGVVLQRGFG